MFVISWVNPDERLAEKSFDAYLLEGTLAAVDAIVEQTGAKEINAAGYCLGGTLLATTPRLHGRQEGQAPGVRHLLHHHDRLRRSGRTVRLPRRRPDLQPRKKMFERGYLEGSEMAGTFNMLRANDLIWSFVVNNYLMGRIRSPSTCCTGTPIPPACRQDAQLLPAQHVPEQPPSRSRAASNRRRAHRPVQDQGSDLLHLHHRRPHCPVEGTYSGARNFGGNVRFVLGGSGHIAGIVNPPAANKYGYWTTGRQAARHRRRVLQRRRAAPGSWWTDWQAWLMAQDSNKVPARDPAQWQVQGLEDAPGSFVKARLDAKEESRLIHRQPATPEGASAPF